MKVPRPDEINPNLWYGVVQTSKLLGIDRKTVNSKAAVGAMNGGLDYRPNRGTGRKEFKGEELLRYLYGEMPDVRTRRKIRS